MSNHALDHAYLARIRQAVAAVHELATVPRDWWADWPEDGRGLVNAGDLDARDFLLSVQFMIYLGMVSCERPAPERPPTKPRRGRPKKAEQWLRRQLEGLDPGPDEGGE